MKPFWSRVTVFGSMCSSRLHLVDVQRMAEHVGRPLLAKLTERVVWEIGAREIRGRNDKVAGRGLARPRRGWRQLNEAAQRQVCDAVRARPGGAEVAQV